MPESLIINHWGRAGPARLTRSALTLTRRDGATTTPLAATVTRVTGGLIVSLPSFSYSSPTFAMAPLPTVSSISVNTADAAGGATVVITGRALRGASVAFGGTPATSVTYDSSTQLTAIAPAHATGAAPVVVTTSGGSVTAPGSFFYTGATDHPPVTLLPPSMTTPGAPTPPIVTHLPVPVGL